LRESERVVCGGEEVKKRRDDKDNLKKKLSAKRER
jgi:hypothetical protein